MIHTLSRRRTPRALLSLLCSVFLTAQALAQPIATGTATASRPDPLDAKAPVPALRYESAMAQYRRLSDEKPVSWRDANDTVTRIGGWRVYAREAQQPDPAPAAKPGDAAPASKPVDAAPAAKPKEPGITTPAKPMPAGHGGHKMP